MNPMRLLMIDDDPDWCPACVTVMESAGWEVHSAPNGAEGLEKARELAARADHPGHPHAPQGRADHLRGAARRRLASAAIPIIVLTSVSEKLGFGFSASDMAEHYGHQPEAFLQKPFEPQHLVETARRVARPRG